MPWTLYRFIIRELLKLMVFTTIVMGVVISFAAAIKPMSEGLLTPTSLLRFVLYMSPTMLQFSLPFAGAFAGTMLFTRMVSDNEILACSAGGMSYRAILLPVLALGLAMTLGLFYVSNAVVPAFYKQAARMIEKDFMRMLVLQVQKQEAVRLGQWLLYADAAADADPPTLADTQVQPTKRIVLQGVAVGQIDGDGKVTNESTAERADLLLFEHEGDSWVTVKLEGGTSYVPARGQHVGVRVGRVAPMRLPTPFRDDPRFYAWGELRELGVHPDRFYKVRTARRELESTLAARRLTGMMYKSLQEGRLVLRSSELVYQIHAPQVSYDVDKVRLKATKDGPIDIEVYRVVQPDAAQPDGKPRDLFERRIAAREADLAVIRGAAGEEPSVEPLLIDAMVEETGPGGTTQNVIAQVQLPRVGWPTSLIVDVHALSLDELLAVAQQLEGRDVEVLRTVLRWEVSTLGRKIIAQINVRTAHAISFTLVLLISALLSIWLRGSMPLVVYLGSFLLAILVLVTILSGNAATSHRELPLRIGLITAWSGNAVALAALVIVFLRVRRN